MKPKGMPTCFRKKKKINYDDVASASTEGFLFVQSPKQSTQKLFKFDKLFYATSPKQKRAYGTITMMN